MIEQKKGIFITDNLFGMLNRFKAARILVFLSLALSVVGFFVFAKVYALDEARIRIINPIDGFMIALITLGVVLYSNFTSGSRYNIEQISDGE